MTSGESEADVRGPLTVYLMALTFTTGLIDAVSILGLGNVFTALMTGNVVFVGLSVAGAPGVSAARSIVALGAFSLGAVAGGRVSRRHRPGALRRWILVSAGMESALVLSGAAVLGAALGAEALLGDGTLVGDAGTSIAHVGHAGELAVASYMAIACAAAAMGIRSATVIALADPDLKTTVLTLTITGLAADSPLAGGLGRRWGRRVVSVALLGLGACAGAMLCRETGTAIALAVVAFLVLGATLGFAAHRGTAVPLAQTGPKSPSAAK